VPFSEVVGHRTLVGLVSRAVARGTLPPSLIFAGPDGVGKHLVAVALAQTLNCQTPIRGAAGKSRVRAELEIDACGVCRSCRRIARGTFADVGCLEPGETGLIPIDPIRGAIDQATYRPFEGRARVVIIDQADRLVSQAQNALLKTLEEPPSASVFVLVSSRADVLLATVLSRCTRLRFGRLTTADVASVLVSRHGYTAADAQVAAMAAADGSVGGALDRQQAEYAAARDAAVDLLTTAARGSDPRLRIEGAKALAGGGGTRSSAAAERESLAMRLRALSSLLRDVGVILARADERWLANMDLRPRLAQLTQAYDSDRILRAFSAVDRALGALVERNASPKVVADWLAFQL
jgi:DNA polymerase-3 subunit delta'